MNSYVELSLIILLPAVVVGLLSSLVFGEGKGVKGRVISGIKLNPAKGLDEQGLLWVVILVPVSYFFVFGWHAWDTYEISIDAEGFETFIAISELPLWLLSVSIPLSILVARIHATRQTSLLIKITNYKNNIDSFYSHRNELFKYFEKIGEVDYLSVLVGKYQIHPRLHKNFFKGTPEEGIPLVNEDSFKDIESELKSAAWGLDTVIDNVNPDITFDIYVCNFGSTIYRISQKLGIKEIINDLAGKSILVPVNLEREGKKELLTVGVTTDDAIAAFRYVFNFYHNLCDFCGREPVKLDEEYTYLLLGQSYKTKVTPLVIEEIHEHKIPSMKNQHNNTP